MRGRFYFLVLSLATTYPAIAEVPSKFSGEWTVEVEKGPGFPWWERIKHPVSLSITSERVIFKDQGGYACQPLVFLYDAELDALIFTHCLPAKSEISFPPFYRAKIDGARLRGETWTYKSLFRWSGERQD